MRGCSSPRWKKACTCWSCSTSTQRPVDRRHRRQHGDGAQRYVYTLHQFGYLNKDAESKLYFPALKLLGLVRGIHRHRSQMDLAYPLLQALAAETLETVSWVELDRDDVVVLQNFAGAHVAAVNLPVGSRFRVHVAYVRCQRSVIDTT